jgi:hypothetical protein
MLLRRLVADDLKSARTTANSMDKPRKSAKGTSSVKTLGSVCSSKATINGDDTQLQVVPGTDVHRDLPDRRSRH